MGFRHLNKITRLLKLFEIRGDWEECHALKATWGRKREKRMERGV
jgi:hypothetical protein